MDEPVIVSRTLILIDPSSPNGEAGIDVLTPDDTAVTLMLTLGGQTASSLREFAAAEEIDVSTAGLIYLDQVACRVSARTGDIDTIPANTSDAVDEIFYLLEKQPVSRVIVPASLAGNEPAGLSNLVRTCPVPVVVAPADAEPPRVPLAS